MWLNTSVVEGVPMNPKEYHVAAVSLLNIRLKKKISPRLVRLLMDLSVDHQREDTQRLNFSTYEWSLTSSLVDTHKCELMVLSNIIVSLLKSCTWWYVISSIRHLYVTLYKWMGKTWSGKSVAKNTEINKTFHIWFWICHFVYSYHKTITGYSFSCTKT